MVSYFSAPVMLIQSNCTEAATRFVFNLVLHWYTLKVIWVRINYFLQLFGNAGKGMRIWGFWDHYDKSDRIFDFLYSSFILYQWKEHFDLFCVINFKVKALFPLWLRQVPSLSNDFLIFLQFILQVSFMNTRQALELPAIPHGIHTMGHFSNLRRKRIFNKTVEYDHISSS